MFQKVDSNSKVNNGMRFDGTKMYFTNVDFSLKMSVGQILVGKVFIVSAISRNFKMCLYGSQSASLFDIQPPSFQEYIAHMQ